jgi:hypothetical protein
MFEMTPSVIDVRSCVPFEPQKLEFSLTCQNFIQLPRCQLESLTQYTLLFQRVPTNDRGWVEFNNGANLGIRISNVGKKPLPQFTCRLTFYLAP